VNDSTSQCQPNPSRIMIRTQPVCALLVAIAALAIAANVSAANVTKADNTDNLNLGSSWTGNVPPTSADVAVWDSTVTAANTVNLGATTNWAGIQILNPAGAVSITNASTTLIIGASGVDTSSGTQTLTLSCPVALATSSANNVWNLTANVTLSGGLSGTNILEKTGSGTLNLSTGTGAATIQIDSGIVSVNTSGLTITNALNGGTVNINAAVSNPINVTSGGGTEQNAGGNRTWSGPLSGSGPLTVVASSTHSWAGNNSAYTGTITLQGSGTLRLNSLTAVSAGTAYNFNNGNMTANASGILNLGSLAGSGTLSGGSGQNYSIGALNANSDFTGPINGGTVIIKTGTGTQSLSGTNNYTGNTIVSNGVLQIGDGGSSGSLASPVVFVTNANSTLSFNRGDAALNFTNVITGVGTVRSDGSGTVLLSGANTYSGGTILNNGTLEFAGGALGTGGIIFNNSAALQWAPGNTADISSQTITINSSGTLDVNGNTVTLASPIGNSGSGALTVKSTAANGILNLQNANTYTGGTFVSSGTLNVNNTTGSGTGVGNVTVNGGILGGTGTISGAVDVQSYLAPGTGVGTLTVNSLTIESTATNNFEFNSTPANDKVVVTTSGGFVVNGGTFNLYQAGTTLPWIAPGTYTLFQFSGSAPSLDASWTTASASNPHIANPQTGLQYSFAASGSAMTLTITSSGSAVFGAWTADANGNWSDATKWSSNPNVPHAAGDTATLGVGSALRTVTLDANETSGTINFTNDNSFVIASAGKTLTLDNSGSGALVNVTAGTVNAIQTAVGLNDNATVTVSANKTLAISGAIANSSGAKSLTLSGAGTFALSGNNSYGPAASSGFGTTLAGGGTLQVGNNNALGAGDVSIANSGTLQAGAAGLTLPNNLDVASGATATVDNHGNNLTLSGVISDSGNLSKIGNGTLTLSGNNSYFGDTTVDAGVLNLSADANVGSSPNIILNGGALLGGAFDLSSAHNIAIGATTGTLGTNALIDAASGQIFQIDGVIASAGNSGADNLIINSLPGDNGTLILAGVNTFNGFTAISNGVLQVMNSFALQNSTLDYDSGTLVFDGSLLGATFGGLAGTNALQNLALTNLAGNAVPLSVGRNNATTVFSGNLSGSGALTKQGTGTLTLSNANYTGATTIGGGGGVLNIYGGNFGSSSSAFVVGTSGNAVSNATMNASQVNVGTSGGQTSASLAILGNATVTNATGLTIGSSGNTSGNFTINTTASANLGAVLVNRDAGAVTAPTRTAGLIVNNGAVIANSVIIARSGVGGRGADLNVNGGALTIGDSSSATAFEIDSTAGNGFATMTGGSLTYLGTDGLLMSVGAGVSGAVISGGTANLTGITLNSGNTATTSFLIVSNGGTIYLGSIGLVINSPSATIAATFGNGTIGALADWSSSAPITLAGMTTFQAADGSGVAHNISLSGILSGAGGLTKTGNGTLTLSGANTYASNTIVSAGTLDLMQPSLFTNSTVSVSNGATLKLDFAGTNIVGGLVLNGVSKTNGVYNSSTDPAFLSGAGNIQVVPVVSTIPAPIVFTVSGNILTLSWPADHLGWHLQVQTNSIAVGLGTNWVTLPGSDAVTSTNITLDPVNGSVFYRLVYP
jgi:fibronectin-binding autotransporter adhesin